MDKEVLLSILDDNKVKKLVPSNGESLSLIAGELMGAYLLMSASRYEEFPLAVTFMSKEELKDFISEHFSKTVDYKLTLAYLRVLHVLEVFHGGIEDCLSEKEDRFYNGIEWFSCYSLGDKLLTLSKALLLFNSDSDVINNFQQRNGIATNEFLFCCQLLDEIEKLMTLDIMQSIRLLFQST